jgi:hypothetical protein
MFLPLAGLVCLLLTSHETGAGDKDNKSLPGAKPKFANLTFVPTADEVIEKMFELGQVTKKDILFDLGCGDNRICFMAAKKFGCKGVGVEINPVRIREAMDMAEKYAVGLLVETRHGDALNVKDLGDATVVVMYMFPEFMNLWEPIAKAKLRPGTRILSHDYRFSKWEPDLSVTVKSATREHKVYMWTVK